MDTLEVRGHWATMEELLEVVKIHLLCYENTVKICKSSPTQVNPLDLTFATKFVAMYLFIKVKGSRPMTYQYLTVGMIATAKAKGGFIDQKTSWRIGSSISKVLCNRAVPQKNTKDGCKDDEIAVDTRFRH